MKLTSLDALISLAISRPKRRIAIAAAADKLVLQAVLQAYSEGIIEPVLIGDADEIIKIISQLGFDSGSFSIINEKDPVRAAILAVQIIKEGSAEILMKGNVSSAPLLKALLDKKTGLRKRELLSHLALIQTSYYHKLLGITDAGMNIAPTLEEKISIIENAVEIYHKLGVECPKVAALGPVEVVNEKIQSTLDARELKQLQINNVIRGCLIDGPLALDNAVSYDAARHKGIVSEVAGDADILLVPDLNAGNILYKSLNFLSDGISAAIVTGAAVPVVLTSRADDIQSKLYSIALAAALD